LLFDLDDAKKQFLHFYPVLTVIIEAFFASNVKIILQDTGNRSSLNVVIYSHLAMVLID